MKRQTWAALMLVLPLASLSHAAWMDPEWSVDDYKLMTIPELMTEALDICSKVVTDIASADRSSMSGKRYSDLPMLNQAIQLRDQADRRRRYFDRLGLVLRDKNQGIMPEWFDQMKKASYSRDARECRKAAMVGGWQPKP